MITKIIDENSISVIPEDSDDLFNLRRIIKEGGYSGGGHYTGNQTRKGLFKTR